MERQAGLGRSLEEVLDSLTPAETESWAAGRVLFEPEDIEQQLDQLMGDIRDLRERVQHLVGMIPDGVVLDGTPATKPEDDKSGKQKQKQKQKRKQGKQKRKQGKQGRQGGRKEHDEGRSGSATRKTK